MSELPAPAEVAPGVFVATASTCTTTTTVVAGADGGCLLIDPAVTPADLTALAAWLASRGLRPVAGWSTHPHWDHLLWSQELGQAPRYATLRAAATAVRERNGLIDAVMDAAPGHDLGRFGRVEALLEDEIDWPGPRAVVCAHDAHAPGHGAVFLPDSGVLIAGDMCSDIEIPLPDLDTAASSPAGAGTSDPFGDYRSGLGLLAGIGRVRVIVPGHGAVGDAAEFRRRVAADQRYLEAVAAGTDIADDRLAEGRPAVTRLRAEHARALERARAS